MSTRRNPMAELERFFDRWSRRFGESEWDGGFEWQGFGSAAVDLVDRDDEFVVTVDLPGFERDDVEVSVTDRTLRIEAERETGEREESEDEGERYLRQERRHRAVDRSIRLPDEIDTDATTAAMRNGVLTVTLPRLVVEEAHTVEID